MASRTFLTGLCTLALASMASSHMIMAEPVPYSNDTIDSSPITGSQFPCKKNLGYTISHMNQMAVGEKQTLKFSGSAVHGGGSCQLAVSIDRNPSEHSIFKVIHSIEGGCPGVDGPEEFEYSIPDTVPSGQLTFAWTWFSKESGAPEMYMNCAPISVSGGASDTVGFDSLPDLFVANIDIVDCTSPQNYDTIFPDPGSSVVKSPGANLKDPSGADCKNAFYGGTSGDESSSSSTYAAASATSSASEELTQTQSSTTEASEMHNTAAAGDPQTANQSPTEQSGGVFAPRPTSGGTEATSEAVTSSSPESTATTYATTPISATSTITSFITLTSSTDSAPAESTPAESTPASATTQASAAPVYSTAPASPQPSGGSSGGSPGSTGKCSANGALVCNGENLFGICNNGVVIWQQVAPGTKCTNGAIGAASKRDIHIMQRGRIARPRVVRNGRKREEGETPHSHKPLHCAGTAHQKRCYYNINN